MGTFHIDFDIEDVSSEETGFSSISLTSQQKHRQETLDSGSVIIRQSQFTPPAVLIPGSGRSPVPGLRQRVVLVLSKAFEGAFFGAGIHTMKAVKPPKGIDWHRICKRLQCCRSSRSPMFPAASRIFVLSTGHSCFPWKSAAERDRFSFADPCSGNFAVKLSIYYTGKR
jgi:hypothetical protein